MRRIITIAVLAAIAILATAAVASASVSYDPSNGGAVGKGDVQNALGLKNDAAMADYIAKNGQPKFTYKSDGSFNWAWTCDDGLTHTAKWGIPESGSAASTATVNNGKTVGWTLRMGTDRSFGDFSIVGNPLECPTGTGTPIDGKFGVWEYANTQMFVNGHALPITPAVPTA